MKSLVKKLIKLLIEKKLTVSFAESVTCGLASNGLNCTPGTSDVFRGSIVCYNEEVKTNLLKIDAELIKKFTAESQEVTDALAMNLQQLIEADIYVAITGLNADGGSETPEKPVGTVFFSLLHNGKLIRCRKLFKGSPQRIKKEACKQVYKMIIAELEK
ncbi:MAG: CinA family protein [Ginsengibacter sp.]